MSKPFKRELFKRRVRIEGPDVSGHSAVVRDVDTNEVIPGVFRVVATVDVSDTAKADITYYETDEQGHILAENGEPIVHTARVEDPKIDIKAMERLTCMDDVRILSFRGGVPGSCVEIVGMINGTASFYFQAQHRHWQFLAGAVYIEDLMSVLHNHVHDHRVLTLHGDDQAERYIEKNFARGIVNICAQQYLAWVRRKREASII